METNRINVKDLNVAGADLFNDKESFLKEVKGEDLVTTQGGSTPLCIASPIVTAGLTLTVIRRL